MWFNSVKCVSRPENIFHQTQVRKPRKLTQFYSSDDMRVSASCAQHLNTPVPPLPGSGLGNLIWRVCSSIYLTISEEKWGPTVELDCAILGILAGACLQISFNFSLQQFKLWLARLSWQCCRSVIIQHHLEHNVAGWALRCLTILVTNDQHSAVLSLMVGAAAWQHQLMLKKDQIQGRQWPQQTFSTFFVIKGFKFQTEIFGCFSQHIFRINIQEWVWEPGWKW